MEWLADWNESYSLSILFFGLAVCFFGIILYLFINYRKLLEEIKTKEKLENELLNKNAQIEALSKELANQIEYEIAQRLKSDYSHDYLFENSLNAIILAQDENLNIIRRNHAALNLFGKEILNHNILELFNNKADKKSVFEKITQLKQSKLRQNFRLDLTLEDSTIPVVVSIHFMNFAQKTTLYFAFVDISDIVKLENELRNKRVELIQKNKEEAMGKMLGNIAHQWKQPLNSLSLLCQNLKEMNQYGELDNDNFEKYTQMMTKQIRFMSRTIDAFREFYNPSKNKETFEVYGAIKEVLELFYQLVDKKIMLKMQPCKHKKQLKVYANKNELQQVMIVLLDNAIEATKARLSDGKIKEGRILIDCSMEQNIAGSQMCVIRVLDNGGGISPEIGQQIFEAFFTTKGNGSGMGLAMAQMILDKMEGRIFACNEKDGVEFKVELPMANEDLFKKPKKSKNSEIL
ncbi:ATP-binding protein [Helicobacter sp. MIT 05-5294]|uniref:sensor histidine kinase n=1 Tax=Helicobacter sp. MIT 05-5294 TaxID=1548150 RepID=UPI001EE93D84|nr:ATP-binding protein [Helicobacter sp. MIT 05-5294]